MTFEEWISERYGDKDHEGTSFSFDDMREAWTKGQVEALQDISVAKKPQSQVEWERKNLPHRSEDEQT